MSDKNWKIQDIFESEVAVNTGEKIQFDVGLLNNIIQYHSEGEEEEGPMERVRYRVILEVHDEQR